MKKVFLIIGIAIGANQWLVSQSNSVTEKQVMGEAVFIQAMQEKILGNTDKAIKLFERTIKEQEDNDAAHFQLAQLYIEKEKEKEAFEHIQKAANLSPSNIYYQKILADHYEKQKMYSAAAQVYEKMYNAGHREIKELDKWAYNCVKSNNLDQAEKILKILENAYGLSTRLAKKQYDVFTLQKKSKKAESVLIELVDLNDQNTEALYMLAMHYKKQGREEKSKEYFHKILAINPNDSKANIALAENFKQGGEDSKFLNSISTIIDNDNIEVDLKIKELIPYVEKMQEGTDEELNRNLLDIANRMQQVHPNDAKVYALSGDIFYHADQIDNAIEAYGKSIEIRPDIWSVWQHLMYLQAENGRESDLIKLTTKAKDYFPNQALVYYMNAIGQGKMMNYDEALMELDDASLMVGSNIKLKTDIFALKGTLLAKTKQISKAQEFLNKALELNPDYIPAINTLAQTYLTESKELDVAEKLIERGLKLNPDYLPLIASKGKLMYLKNDFTAAKDLLSKALEMQGNTDTALIEVLGDTLYKLNQVDRAVELWQKAVELASPNVETLQKKINSKSLVE